MSEREPSVFDDVRPVNRIENVPDRRQNVWETVRDYLEQRPIVTIDRDEQTAIDTAVDRRSIYRAAYAMARSAMELGDWPDTIRTEVIEMFGRDQHASAIDQAIEDALKGRPERW